MIARSPALTFLSLLAFLAVLSCASGGGGSVASAVRASGKQSKAEVDKIMGGLKPTERFVANADAQLLWQAASGYMERAFPLDQLPPAATSGEGGSRQIRTRLVEWVGDGLPHRTRVFVEVRRDAENAAHMRLRVIALLIESEPQLELASPGQPLEYNWRLAGNNARVEETVADHILKRYLALREGKPLPLEEEMILPGREAVGG
jgi:hypothetical protein